MKIAVLGAGAIGGYFGALLARSGSEVHLVARGRHLDALRADGLRIRSGLGDLHLHHGDGGLRIAAGTGEVGAADVVLFCVKSYDTDEAARSLAPMLGPDTGVVSLQNGIDNEEKLAAVIGPEHVMGGVAYIFARLAGPGEVVHTGGPRRIIFGELDGRRSGRAEALLRACEAADFPVELSDDIRAALWAKFAFICAQAGLTAVTRLPIGTIREVPESMALFRRVVEEVTAVAAAEGVRLPDDLPDRHIGTANSLEADGRSSLYDDMVAGRRMELDALLGEVVRRAERAGVPVPAAQTLHAVLRPWQLANASPA